MDSVIFVYFSSCNIQTSKNVEKFLSCVTSTAGSWKGLTNASVILMKSWMPMDSPALVSLVYKYMHAMFYLTLNLSSFTICILGECGHIVVPVGVNLPQITDSNGLQKAELSCTRTGYIFSGGKDPSPQFCFRGQWTYEFEDYDIPGCEGTLCCMVYMCTSNSCFLKAL